MHWLPPSEDPLPAVARLGPRPRGSQVANTVPPHVHGVTSVVPPSGRFREPDLAYPARRAARLTADTTARSDAVVIEVAIPTPQTV